ncbi:MAG: hypothetical protein MPJ24_11365 [Pirellulaceae bacterium]|nr:hypothetical protein [Pirellulaceae bacterium]
MKFTKSPLFVPVTIGLSLVFLSLIGAGIYLHSIPPSDETNDGHQVTLDSVDITTVDSGPNESNESNLGNEISSDQALQNLLGGSKKKSKKENSKTEKDKSDGANELDIQLDIQLDLGDGN